MPLSLSDQNRIVIKIGSALLINSEDGTLRAGWLNALCDDIAALTSVGKQVLIVSSGSIALGRAALGIPKGSLKLEEKQAAAATGQIALARAWAETLAQKNIKAGQVLLTLEDTEQRRRYLNARATIGTMLKFNVIPIINENDTIATTEIRYGDNDRLAARVATMTSADCLILLSDIDGLYTAPPHTNTDAKHIATIEHINPEIEAMAGTVGTDMASGGMVTKLEAAKIATQAGTHMIIASGKALNPLSAIQKGGRCSWFTAKTTPVNARKTWISGQLETEGTITVDKGAIKALQNGNSLLPAGVTAISGNFERGDTVAILSQSGSEIARGFAAYDAGEAKQIIGRQTADIRDILGYAGRSAMVHRDDMVINEAPDKGLQS